MIHGIRAAKETIEGEGMIVRRAIPNQGIPMVDPFLLLDHMGPRTYGPGEAKGAPDHPHRGFETVTYILDGALEHEDSVGNKGQLGPGDVQWMTAGAGVVHSEMPAPQIRRDGGTIHALQLWVNLPAADKMMPPRYQDIAAASIPEATFSGGRARIIAGNFAGQEAIIQTRTPITYIHFILEAGGSVDATVPEGHNGFLYVVQGNATADGETLDEATIAICSDTTRLASQDGSSILLITGKPIGEPVVQWGPFVMNTEAEIVTAVRDYQSGRMGEIARDDA